MPRIATGYWNATNSPSRARSSGFSPRRSRPSYSATPSLTVYPGWPPSTWASVHLPGAHREVDAPEDLVAVDPRMQVLDLQQHVVRHPVSVIRRCPRG